MASSIMEAYHEIMKERHVQAKLSAAEYEAVAAGARKSDMTIQQALRVAALLWAERQGTYRDPFEDFIGSLDLGGMKDASERVDEIVYDWPYKERQRSGRGLPRQDGR